MSKTLREELREHQAATHCSDDHMVGILCDFLEKLDDDADLGCLWHETLFAYVADRLEKLPGEVTVPYWQLPMFTDEDRELIVERVMDEVGDTSIKDLAHEQLDNEDLIETISYACGDPEEMAQILDSLGTQDDQVSGEFMRIHDEDGELAIYLDFAKRMGLINEGETEVTERGEEFRSRWS